LDGPGFDAQVLAILHDSQGLTVTALQAAMASSNKWVLCFDGFLAMASVDAHTTIDTCDYMSSCRSSSPSIGALTAMLDRLVSEGQVIEKGAGVYGLPSANPSASQQQRSKSQSTGAGDSKAAGNGASSSSERLASPDAPQHKPHPLAATLEGPVMELLKRYPSVRLERLYNVLVKREDR
jgi:hypothetical protein